MSNFIEVTIDRNYKKKLINIDIISSIHSYHGPDGFSNCVIDLKSKQQVIINETYEEIKILLLKNNNIYGKNKITNRFEIMDI